MGHHDTMRWAVLALLFATLIGGAALLVRNDDTKGGAEAAIKTLDPTSATVAGPPVVPAAPPIESMSPLPATTLAAPAGDGGTLPNDTSSCLTGDQHAPTGELVVVPGSSEPSGGGTLTRYIVEVEAGLAVDAECFAAEVDRILRDDRSWGGNGSMSMQRVDTGAVAFRVTLSSPATTDLHCRPLETNGIYSCWAADGRAMINVWRWEHGTEEYVDDLDTYREYVINHEVGHSFGHGHVPCTGPGDLAPVMAQHTKTLDGCAQNGWPLTWER